MSSDAFSLQFKGTSVHFMVDNSKTGDVAFGDFLPSRAFAVAGSNWQLQYYPKGYSPDREDNMVSFALRLLATTVPLTVDYELGLLTRAGTPTSNFWFKSTQVFSNAKPLGKVWDVKRASLDTNYVVDNKFTLICSITTVNKPSTMVKSCSFCFPVNLAEQLHSMLERKAHVDITFVVGGEQISAHRLVLARRSPVFEADLFSPTVDRNCGRIQVKDIKPLIFKGVLHYVYTDCLPKMEDVLTTDRSEDIMPLDGFYELLIASAEKYELIGLRNLCEDRLCGLVSIQNAVKFLALADDGKYVQLKESCVEFIADGGNFYEVGVTKEYSILWQTHPHLYDELGVRFKSKIRSAAEERMKDEGKKLLKAAS